MSNMSNQPSIEQVLIEKKGLVDLCYVQTNHLGILFWGLTQAISMVRSDRIDLHRIFPK